MICSSPRPVPTVCENHDQRRLGWSGLEGRRPRQRRHVEHRDELPSVALSELGGHQGGSRREMHAPRQPATVDRLASLPLARVGGVARQLADVVVLRVEADQRAARLRRSPRGDQASEVVTDEEVGVHGFARRATGPGPRDGMPRLARTSAAASRADRARRPRDMRCPAATTGRGQPAGRRQRAGESTAGRRTRGRPNRPNRRKRPLTVVTRYPASVRASASFTRRGSVERCPGVTRQIRRAMTLMRGLPTAARGAQHATPPPPRARETASRPPSAGAPGGGAGPAPSHPRRGSGA